jgi:MoaA/NifB/PqqE/SkfB family radical SAM enzyme
MISQYEQNIGKLRRFLDTYSKRHDSRYGTPLVFSILITNKCNLRCKHCFYHETISCGDKISQLSLDEYEKISLSMKNFLTGIFCGGEPFLRQDMAEIINIFRKNNNMMMADSASNGQLTDKIIVQVEKILKSFPGLSYSLGLSIDGFRLEHDNIRGEGTFDRAMITWKELKKIKKYHKNFELYICSTINTINEHIMAEFFRWSFKFLDPDKISLLKIRQSPRAGDNIKNIDLSNYLNCIEVIEEHMKTLPVATLNMPQTYILNSAYNYIYDGEIYNKKQFKCYAGLHGGFIDYDGSVGVCEVFPSIGNLRDFNYDFDSLWNSREASKIRTLVNDISICDKCTHEAEALVPSIFFEPNEIKYARKQK